MGIDGDNGSGRRLIRGRASLAGFEPATHCLEGSCSIHLSYRDTLQ